MIKRISLVRRKAGMDADAFHAHWTGPHAAIIRRLPGLRGLRFNRVQAWSPADAAWDGVGEVWFDSIEAASEAFATEPFATELAADRVKFLGEAQSCFVEEETAVPPPRMR